MGPKVIRHGPSLLLADLLLIQRLKGSSALLRCSLPARLLNWWSVLPTCRPVAYRVAIVLLTWGHGVELFRL